MEDGEYLDAIVSTRHMEDGDHVAAGVIIPCMEDRGHVVKKVWKRCPKRAIGVTLYNRHQYKGNRSG
jgi:hypothetical protein